MKLSNVIILVLILFLWIVPCYAGNKIIAYYDPHGNMVTKEMYFEICRQRNKDHIKDTELKAQLHNFLRNYCQTFENKNLNKFKGFFTADAMERGKSFSSVLSKYRRNFEILDSIGYQIELIKYFQKNDTGILEIQGRFRVNWLSHGADWQKKSGSISMSLIKYNNSYRIKRLDYNVEI
jgi:hypothetical protein